MARTGKSEYKISWVTACSVMALSLVLLLVLLVLGAGAWLREVQLFWRNAGGYPVWLREMVYYWFFPWYGLSLVLLCFWQIFVLQATLRFRRAVIPCYLLSAFYWGIFCLISYITLENNILNLINGRAFHAH